MIKSLPFNPIVFGELGLDGSIKSVRGLLGNLLVAVKAGHKHFIIPEKNLRAILTAWGYFSSTYQKI